MPWGIMREYMLYVKKASVVILIVVLVITACHVQLMC